MIKPGDRLPLEQGQLDVWFAVSGFVADRGHAEDYEALLSDEEAEQYRALQYPEHRFDYLLSRALLRTALSHYAPVAPADWRFVRNRFGKPEVAPEHDVGGLQFNIALTDGLVICAASRDASVGVDVEYHGHGRSMLDVADQYFAKTELEALNAMPAAQRRRAFFDYWTLKESLIKARGEGLSAPLGSFAFDISDGDVSLVASEPGFVGPDEDWHFLCMELGEEYTAAVSLANRASLVRYREAVPLEGAIALEGPQTLFDPHHRDALPGAVHGTQAF